MPQQVAGYRHVAKRDLDAQADRLGAALSNLRALVDRNGGRLGRGRDVDATDLEAARADIERAVVAMDNVHGWLRELYRGGQP